MSVQPFTLHEGEWYALTMFPGYPDVPYHSPFRVDHIGETGDGLFQLNFLNLAYAAGVRQFDKAFDTLMAAPDFLACRPVQQPERMYVFTRLTPAWMRKCFPDIPTDRLFDGNGRPVGRAFLAFG